MGYPASAGLPGKTAAYQRAMALYQRAVAGCGGATLASKLLRRVTPVPRHPNAPGVALTCKAETPKRPIAWGFCFGNRGDEHRSSSHVCARNNVGGAVLMLSIPQHQEISHENFAFHAGDFRLTARIGTAAMAQNYPWCADYAGFGSQIVGLQPFNSAGCLERERRLLQCQYAIRFPSRPRSASTRDRGEPSAASDAGRASQPLGNESQGVTVHPGTRPAPRSPNTLRACRARCRPAAY